MNTDEIIIRDQAAEINRLRARLEVLATKTHPKGAALKVFNAFWEAHKSLQMPPKELASLAFDAGHKLRHEKESK